MAEDSASPVPMDVRLDESHQHPDSFQQLVFAAVMSEHTVERRLRAILSALIHNAQGLTAEVKAGTRSVDELEQTLASAEANIHVMVKGVMLGPG